MSELKKCPFCGNSPVATPSHTILCNTCHREFLPEIWQSRPLEDALKDRIVELETFVLGIVGLCEPPNFRVRMTQLQQCKFLDNLRDDAKRVLKVEDLK